MDNNNIKVKDDNRKDYRVPAELGTTVIINSGNREIIGTIKNKSEGGLGLRIPDSSKQYLEKKTMMTVTYSMPYGLVSQQAQICWSRLDQAGELSIGASFVDTEKGFQTN